jgi:hypothetical protein
LLQAIDRDIDLLQFDYSFSLGGGRARKGPESVVIRGRTGIVSTTPKGYCYAQIKQLAPKGARVSEFIDLRIAEGFAPGLSQGLTIHRKRAKVNWIEALPPLLEFLRPRVQTRLTVEHVDRVT